MAERVCAVCGKAYTAKRSDSKTCGPTCRSRASVMGGAPVVPIDGKAADLEQSAASVAAATLQALIDAGREDSPLGRSALVLARRLDAGARETGPALASLAKQLEATLAVATEGARKVADPLDELRVMRERRNAG